VSSGKKESNSRIFFTSALLLFLIVKLSQLLTDIETFIAFEELTNGCLPKDLLNGNLLMGFFDYQAYPHSGGTLISGLLTFPLFLLFGANLISLKLLPLLFAFFTLLIWYKIIDEHFGYAAALIFSFLYIFSGEVFSKGQLIAWGNHCESNLFTALTLLIVVKMISKEKEESSDLKHILLLGIIAGGGLYYDYIYLISLAAAFLTFIFLQRTLFRVKNLVVFFLAFFAGFSPWFLYRVYYYFFNREKLAVFSNIFSKRVESSTGFGALIRKAYKIIVSDIPSTLTFNNVAPSLGKISAYLIFGFFIIFLFSFLFKVIAKQGKNIPAIYSFSYIALFLAIFLFSGFYNSALTKMEWFYVSKYRYFIPLLPFIYFFVSVGITDIFKRERMKAVKILLSALCIIMAITALWDNLFYVKPSKFLTGKIFRGYSYWELLPSYIEGNTSRSALLNIAENIEGDIALSYLPATGKKLYSLKEDELKQVVNSVSKRRDELKGAFYSGMGEALFEKFGNDVQKVATGLTDIPGKFHKKCYEGYLFGESKKEAIYEPVGGWNNIRWNIGKPLNLIEKLPPRYREDAYKGLGRTVMGTILFITTSKMLPIEDLMPKCLKVLKSVPEEGKNPVLRGYGYSVSSYWLEGINRFILIQKFSENKKNAVFSRIIDENIANIISPAKYLLPEQLKGYLEGLSESVEDSIEYPLLKNYILERISQNEREILRGYL